MNKQKKTLVNIAERLKHQPRGTKLYSPVCGECTLYKVDDVGRITVFSTHDNYYNFFFNGTMDDDGECILFPSKDNQDWSTYNVFENGSFVVSERGTIGIYKVSHADFSPQCVCHCALPENNHIEFDDYYLVPKRHATEDEKNRLLDAINKNGHIWDAEKLELKSKTKFNIGDIINYVGSMYKITGIEKTCYNVFCIDDTDDEERCTAIGFISEDKMEKCVCEYKFNAFDKILAKASNGIWMPTFFGCFIDGQPYSTNMQPLPYNIIPYEGHAYLEGTSNEPIENSL